MVGIWHGHGMASVNQTRPHLGVAWERHAVCESAFSQAMALCTLLLPTNLTDILCLVSQVMPFRVNAVIYSVFSKEELL